MSISRPSSSRIVTLRGAILGCIIENHDLFHIEVHQAAAQFRAPAVPGRQPPGTASCQAEVILRRHSLIWDSPINMSRLYVTISVERPASVRFQMKNGAAATESPVGRCQLSLRPGTTPPLLIRNPIPLRLFLLRAPEDRVSSVTAVDPAISPSGRYPAIPIRHLRLSACTEGQNRGYIVISCPPGSATVLSPVRNDRSSAGFVVKPLAGDAVCTLQQFLNLTWLARR